MNIAGKHREYLIELLLCYLDQSSNNDNKKIKVYYQSISGGVKKRDAFGDECIERYIDNYNDGMASWEQIHKQTK